MPELRQALVLFGHGARDPEWARPLLRIRDAMLRRAPSVRVEVAFLEHLPPSLEDCVTALAAKGVARVRVLPVFVAQGGHLKKDVPDMVAGLQQRFPVLRIELLPVIGEADSVIEAMAAYACSCLE